MTAKKSAAASNEEVAEAGTPTPEPSKPTAVGGLAELQAKADETAARGYHGSKEKTE